MRDSQFTTDAEIAELGTLHPVNLSPYESQIKYLEWLDSRLALRSHQERREMLDLI